MTGAIALIHNHSTTALTVLDTPTDVSGYGNSGAAANITTGLVVAAATGGTPAYTYAWIQITSSPYTWVINSPAAASTSFTCNALGPGTTADATFRMTVTDATGQTAIADVSAFANNGQPYDNRIERSGGIIP